MRINEHLKEPLLRGSRDEGKRRYRELSSRSLKRKRTKESGSNGECRRETERQAPVEQLWERSREGRKETNRKPSTYSRMEGMGNQA